MKVCAVCVSMLYVLVVQLSKKTVALTSSIPGGIERSKEAWYEKTSDSLHRCHYYKYCSYSPNFFSTYGEWEDWSCHRSQLTTHLASSCPLDWDSKVAIHSFSGNSTAVARVLWHYSQNGQDFYCFYWSRLLKDKNSVLQLLDYAFYLASRSLWIFRVSEFETLVLRGWTLV